MQPWRDAPGQIDLARLVHLSHFVGYCFFLGINLAFRFSERVTSGYGSPCDHHSPVDLIVIPPDVADFPRLSPCSRYGTVAFLVSCTHTIQLGNES
jgi:hypothetical protein